MDTTSKILSLCLGPGMLYQSVEWHCEVMYRKFLVLKSQLEFSKTNFPDFNLHLWTCLIWKDTRCYQYGLKLVHALQLPWETYIVDAANVGWFEKNVTNTNSISSLLHAYMYLCIS